MTRELRRALTPDYTPACKRLVMSNGFYRAMQRDDVELVTAGIDHVERRGIVTDDGVLHETDIIVLATGFDTHAFFRPMELIGRDGICANDVWRDGPRAYQTVALSGFPNFFMMLGPHSPVGNLTLTTVAESQADHIVRLDRALAPPRIRHRGADGVGDRALQCEAACRDAGHGVDHRLQQLVPEQRRRARGVAAHAGRTPLDAGKPRPRPVRPAPAHDCVLRTTPGQLRAKPGTGGFAYLGRYLYLRRAMSGGETFDRSV